MWVSVYRWLIYIYWVINIKLMACNSHQNKAYLTHVCSLHHSLLVHRNTLGSTSALSLECILNFEITNEKKTHKNRESVILNRSWKGYLFTYKIRKQRASPCLTSAGACMSGYSSFFIFLHVCKWTWLCHQYWFWS